MPDPEKITIDVDESDAEIFSSATKNADRFLLFQLSGEFYCISINQIKEVLVPPELTRVPLAPEFVIGVMNLRGEIISVLDIRSFLGLASSEKTADARIIISDISPSLAGILTDRIEGAIEVLKEAIQPPLATISEELRRYTVGQTRVNEKILTLLDLEKIFHSEAIESLRKTVI